MCAWLYDGRDPTMTPTHPLTLTQVGTRLKPGDPMCVTVDEATGQHTVHRHKSTEEATVEEARL